MSFVRNAAIGAVTLLSVGCGSSPAPVASERGALSTLPSLDAARRNVVPRRSVIEPMEQLTPNAGPLAPVWTLQFSGDTQLVDGPLMDGDGTTYWIDWTFQRDPQTGKRRFELVSVSRDGGVRWRVALPGDHLSHLMRLEDDLIVAMTDMGALQAHHRQTGALVWSRTEEELLNASLTSSIGRTPVITSIYDGPTIRFIAVDPQTGDVLWRLGPGHPSRITYGAGLFWSNIYTVPIDEEGNAYVATWDQSPSGMDETYLHSIDATGQLRWTRQLNPGPPDPQWNNPIEYGTPEIVLDGRVILSTGHTVDSSGTRDPEAPWPFADPSIVADDHALFVRTARMRPTHAETLQRVNRRSQQEEWHVDLKTQKTAPFSALLMTTASSALFVESAPPDPNAPNPTYASRLRLFTRSGHELSRDLQMTNPVAHKSPLALHDGRLFVLTWSMRDPRLNMRWNAGSLELRAYDIGRVSMVTNGWPAGEGGQWR